MRTCPECDKTLKLGAKSCMCGWEETPTRGREESKLLASSSDHQCEWRANGKRCRYPVNFFEMGSTKGKCRYHRRCLDGMDGADIVEQSYRDTDAQYQARSNLETYGRFRSQDEEALYQKLFGETV
jgi:hypothetical protein